MRENPGETTQAVDNIVWNIVMKARTETELIADCHGGTEMNLVTALGFYSMFDSSVTIESRTET